MPVLQVRQLERTVSLRDLSIVEMDGKMREMSAATYDGIFVWKISDFTKKRQDAIAGRAPAMFSPGKNTIVKHQNYEKLFCHLVFYMFKINVCF